MLSPTGTLEHITSMPSPYPFLAKFIDPQQEGIVSLKIIISKVEAHFSLYFLGLLKAQA